MNPYSIVRFYGNPKADIDLIRRWVVIMIRV